MNENIPLVKAYRDVVEARYELCLSVAFDGSLTILHAKREEGKTNLYPEENQDYQSYIKDVILPNTISSTGNIKPIIKLLALPDIRKYLEKTTVHTVLLNVVQDGELRFKKLDFSYEDSEKKNLLLLVEDYTDPHQQNFVNALRAIDASALLYRIEPKKEPKFLFGTKALAELLKCPEKELFKFVGKAFANVHTDDLESLKAKLYALNPQKTRTVHRYHLRNYLGEIIYVQGEFSLIQNGNIAYLYTTINDITELEKAYQQVSSLRNNATKDKLTGLMNMDTFMDEVDHDIHHRPHKGNDVMDIIYLNVANFKVFNSNHGIFKGDELLKKITDALKKTFKDNLCCRFAGDQFYIYTQDRFALSRIKKIHDMFLEDKETPVSLLFGIYQVRNDDEKIALLCDRANMAGDKAHDDLRTYYRFYQPKMSEELSITNYLCTHIDEAIEKRWIQVYYQPVVHTMNGKTTCFEALARWNDPNYGFLSPASFIPALEKNHLIYKLDLFLLEQVCHDIYVRRTNGFIYVPVSLNLSRYDFEETGIHEKINDVLALYQIPHEMIHIEITESTLYGSEFFMKEQINLFHQDGYEVWMDDFGSGYSSLNTLQMYDFDVIKLDMSFLRNVNEKSKPIITSIISMAKSLGISTLAEGVETKEHFEFLKSIGCERAQGYYLSKPLPLGEVIPLLESNGHGIEGGLERIFFNEVGKMNVINGALPKSKGSRYVDESSNMKPLSIIVMDGDHQKTIYSNDAYIQYLNYFGIESAEASDDISNNPKLSYSQKIRETMARCEKSGLTEKNDFIDDTKAGRIRYTLLAKVKEQRAFLLEGVILTNSKEEQQNQSNKDNLDTLYTLFDMVSIITPSTNSLKLIYGNVSNGALVDGHLDRDLKANCEHIIHPDDRVRFYSLTDPTTLEKRISATKNHAIQDFIRIQLPTGIGWEHCIISEIPSTLEPKRYLVCLKKLWGIEDPFKVRAMAFEQFDERNAKESIPTPGDIPWKSLWDAALQKLRIGVFWKDKDRRFLGANQMFLEYYHLSSLKDIIGKTDEDMGWHVNPLPFKQDEENLLKNGIIIENAVGECLVHGENHKIIANKFPVYEKGQIVGLLGYFRDTTIENDEKQKAFDEIYKDKITGLFNSIGLREQFNQYLASYKNHKTDFGSYKIHIQLMEGFGTLYGEKTRQNLIRQIAAALREIVSNEGVLAKISIDSFSILTQKISVEDQNNFLKNVDKAIKSIKSVDGVPITIYYGIGFAKYSEANDFEELSNILDYRILLNERVDHSKQSSDDIVYQYNTFSIVKTMRAYRRIFDIVRLVDPTEHTARDFQLESGLLSESYLCYSIHHADHACAYCSAKKALRSKNNSTLYRVIDGKDYLLVTIYVLVNDKPFALELLKRIKGLKKNKKKEG